MIGANDDRTASKKSSQKSDRHCIVAKFDGSNFVETCGSPTCVPPHVGQRQPYHPAAQDWLPTEAPPEKTRLLLKEVFVRPAGGAHHVVCVGPNAPV